jgi:BlaI family transcriptional regulator, penicillinase repressor
MIRLNDLEEQILDVLWELEAAFPKAIMERLQKPIPPYNTILSAIRKLEKEGHIGFNIYGKSHEYYPILAKEEYCRSLFKKLFHDILDGSKTELLSYFMKEEKINIKELEKIIDKIKNDKQ